MAASDELYWRETYFILFPHARRPSLERVSAALRSANNRFQLENLAADASGMMESLLVESAEDRAAVEISYEVGDAVIEQNLAWAKELQKELPPDKLQEIIRADARLDVAHFERVGENEFTEVAGMGDDELEDVYDMLDPTCLLTVVETLSALTGGLTFDPAAGEILD